MQGGVRRDRTQRGAPPSKQRLPITPPVPETDTRQLGGGARQPDAMGRGALLLFRFLLRWGDNCSVSNLV